MGVPSRTQSRNTSAHGGAAALDNAQHNYILVGRRLRRNRSDRKLSGQPRVVVTGTIGCGKSSVSQLFL